MNNQEKEQELYTALGQYIVDSLDHSQIGEWDKAVFTVKVTDGLMVRELNYFLNGNSERIRTIPVSEARTSIFDIIESLKEYTESNNYTPWNKFVFELTSTQKFDVEYSWDQYFHDNRE